MKKIDNINIIDKVLLRRLVREKLNTISEDIKNIEKEYPNLSEYVVDLKEDTEIYLELFKKLS